jgi:hypothetical protein
MENVTIIKFNAIEERIITLRGEKVLLDSDVADLYGVQTRDINKSVKNNPDRFPDGYVFELQNAEKQEVVEIFHHLEKLKFSPSLPKAFTEKGLYMLATILKSPQAVQTSIAIVETFAKIRKLSRTMAELAETSEEVKKKSLMRKSGEIIADILDEEMKTIDTETSIEFNLALLRVKHTVKKTSKM